MALLEGRYGEGDTVVVGAATGNSCSKTAGLLTFPAVDAAGLLLLGDSLTVSPGLPYAANPCGPWPVLLESYNPGLRLVQRARAGATIREVAEQQIIPADICTISAGTNDVLRVDQPLDVLCPLRRLLETAAGACRRVVVFDLPPTQLKMPVPTSHARALRRRQERVNEAIEIAVAEVGAETLRLSTAVREPWCWDADRIHPNAAGQTQLARALAALFGLRPPPPAVRSTRSEFHRRAAMVVHAVRYGFEERPRAARSPDDFEAAT
jgi:lysophospholipase L1-like esterase